MRNGQLVREKGRSLEPIWEIEDVNIDGTCNLKIISGGYACGRYKESTIKLFGIILNNKIKSWKEEME